MAMEQSASTHRAEADFNLQDWAAKARITRENTNSRRYSASYIRSFPVPEDARSFRTNITISSTAASSPGYPLKGEIDPSTYSFTAALRALQARSMYNSWECLSPQGFSLNSKWNEAEKYICNPLSGEFPIECLSAKTLSARSFRNITNRITMSAPLVYSSYYSRNAQINPCGIFPKDVAHIPVAEEKKEDGTTRDAGTQSTPPDLSSASPSPASTPSILERPLKRWGTENGDSPSSPSKSKSEDQAQVKETMEEAGAELGKEERDIFKYGEKQKRQGRGGCLSWMRNRHGERQKSGKRNFFLSHFRGCLVGRKRGTGAGGGKEF